MRLGRRRWLPLLVGSAIVTTLIGARCILPDTFERLQFFAFDTLQRAYPWHQTTAHVRVIDIDDESLKRIGQWPWPRSVVARLVRCLQDSGVKAIAFDVVFAEPDRTSPLRLAKAWEKEFGWRPAAAGLPLPDYDHDLAAVFARGRVVTGFGLVAAPNGTIVAPRAGIATIGEDPLATLQNFAGAITTLPQLQDAAAGNGSFTITAARDQVIRRLPLLFASNRNLLPALSLETVRVGEDEDTIRVRSEGSGSGAIEGFTVRVGDYDIPLDASGGLILHHGQSPPGASIPAWRLLDPAQSTALRHELDGRIALIGTSAVGLSDLRATPLNPLEPGVNMHARAIEQIIARHFLTRPAWGAGAEFVIAAIAGVLTVLLVTFGSLRIGIGAMVAVVVVALSATAYAFSSMSLLLDPSLVIICVVAAGVAGSLARYLVAERDASRLRQAFDHYLSPDLVDVLARDPDRLKLGGEVRDMTFLFTDLEGFTALIEASDPSIIVSLLNAYLDGLCTIAMEHGGTVDKIVGDALHLMFNAPLDQPDHAQRAVRCALAIDAFAQTFAAEQQALGLKFGVTRIGVNTGSAVVGNFGGSRRFDYTAHGDAINTAARLEAANKTLGTRICIAHATVERVDGFAFLPIGTLMLKGKSKGTEVFTLTSQPAEPWHDTYREIFRRMADGDDAAAAMLTDLHARHPENAVLALHARRMRAGETSVRMAA